MKHDCFICGTSFTLETATQVLCGPCGATEYGKEFVAGGCMVECFMCGKKFQPLDRYQQCCKPCGQANKLNKTSQDSDGYANEDLICEALVREIANAKRWMTIDEAWTALLHVRHLGQQLKAERAHSSAGTQEASK